MNSLSRRVIALEASNVADLPPDLRKWLGEPLTEEEERMLDQAASPVSVEPDPIQNVSSEAWQWLLGR